MTHPREVTAVDVRLLDPVTFRSLVNFLIASEASRQSESPSCHLSERNDVADGGIDGEVVGAKETAWFLEGDSVWQYKAGRVPTAGDLEDELRKSTKDDSDERASDRIQAGASYVLVVADDPTPRVQRSRNDHVANLVEGIRTGAASRVLYASDVSRWCNENPASLPFLGKSYPNVMPLKSEASRHPVAYRYDEPRAEVVKEIRDFTKGAAPPGAHLRLEGFRGVGKTRAVIEACADKLDTVLYAEEFPRELFDAMRENPDMHCTLVLDDMDDDAAVARAEANAERIGSRLRLITVGHESVAGPNSLLLKLQPVEHEALTDIVLSVAPNLERHQAEAVSRFARGYVKLGTLVATEVAKNPDASIVDIVGVPQVAVMLRKLFLPDHQAVLQVLSLPRRVGWEGDVATEGQAICKFAGIDWRDAQRIARELVVRGVLTVNGRYRYVTPDILAVMLAKEAWSIYRDSYKELIEALPTQESKLSVIERLSMLRGEPEAESIASDFLDDTGPFLSLDDIDSEMGSRLFHTLALAAPAVGLRRLRLLMSRASPERLLTFSSGRRQIVWLLEELVQWGAWFFDAVRILRELARHENETWANNATGVWSSLFLTFLGGTEVPAEDRLLVVEECVDSPDPGYRHLAVRAIESALQGSEMGRGFGSATKRPSKLWQPRTYGESWAYRRRALVLLDRLRSDPDESVRVAATKSFLHSAVSMVVHGLGDEILSRLESFEPKTEAERLLAWEQLHYLEGQLTDASRRDHLNRARAIASQLYGSSFSHRLRLFVGSTTWVDWSAGDGTAGAVTADRKARELAAEAVDNPSALADEDVHWLVSSDTMQLWSFATELGLRDGGWLFFGRILTAAATASDPRLLSGYLRGASERGDVVAVRRVLDELASDEKTATLAFDATFRGIPSPESLERVLRLAANGWIPAGSLAALSWGRWLAGLPEPGVLQVIQQLAENPDSRAVEGGIEIVLQRVGIRPQDSSPELLNLAWKLLGRVDADGVMLQYEWERLAGYLLSVDCRRVVQSIVEWLKSTQHALHDRRLSLLSKAATDYPVLTWSVLERYLREDPMAPWKFGWWAWEANFLEMFDPVFLLRWMRRAPEKRSRILAHLCQPGDPLSPIVRAIIETAGPESRAARILAANFGSGSWSGSQSARESGRLAEARRWLDDPSPAVRAWARNEVAELEDEIPRIVRYEAEQDFIYGSH